MLSLAAVATTNVAMRASISLLSMIYRGSHWIFYGSAQDQANDSMSLLAVAQAYIDENYEVLKKHEATRIIVTQLNCLRNRITQRHSKLIAISSDKGWFKFWFPVDTTQMSKDNADDLAKHEQLFRMLLKLKKIY